MIESNESIQLILTVRSTPIRRLLARLFLRLGLEVLAYRALDARANGVPLYVSKSEFMRRARSTVPVSVTNLPEPTAPADTSAN
jgi:hypothetical protein